MFFRAFLPFLALGWWAAADMDARPAVLDRAADSHGAVKDTRIALLAVPDCAVKGRILPILDRLDEGAARQPKEKREEFIARNLDDLAGAVTALTPRDAAKSVLGPIQNSVSYLLNLAGRWEESRKLCDEVLSYSPRSVDAWLNRSEAHHGLKNFQNAMDDAAAAVRLDAYNADAYAARALSAFDLGQFQRAQEDARLALALNPGHKSAHSILQLSEGRAPSAVGGAAMRELALRREYHGMVAQIAQVVERSRELPSAPLPGATARRIRAAAGKIALKDYQGAIEEADRALAQDPENTEARYYRAAAHNLLGRYSDAIADATQAISINPAQSATHDVRAYAYFKSGVYKKALADSNYSLELNPNDPYAYANRGFVHEKLGEVEDMLKDFKKAAELNAQFEPVYHGAAAAHGIELPAAARPSPPAAPARAPMSRKQFWTILLYSAAGGLIVALGFLNIFGERWAQPKVPPAARLSKGRSPRAKSTIDDSYEIGAALGKGGMAVVYEAVDRALGRKVAIKMLCDDVRLDAKAKTQFLQEARTVAALHHPNIVDIHSIVADEKGLYLIFEYIDGPTVENLLARKTRLSFQETRTILEPVCEALSFAHRHGVVHRDLKPSNIMLTAQGLVKVMDFGISRTIKDTLQAASGAAQNYAVTNSVLGTPYYMAPEQEYGIVRPESDVYSLGTCLYEMVTGRRPYPPPCDYKQKLSAEYPRAGALDSSLPRSLDVLIEGALRPDPDKRIRGAADFKSLLAAVREAA